MDVQLKVDALVDKGILHVRYILTNQGKLPLLAYDGSPGVPADAKWPDMQGQLYVSVTGDTVALKRINPPQLPGAQMRSVFIPPLSQTMPGESREVRFQMAQPLIERSQYTPDFAGAQYRERAVHKLEVYIGYFWKTDAMQPVPFPENPKAFRLKTAHGPQSVVVASNAVTVQVKERLDDKFQRV